MSKSEHITIGDRIRTEGCTEVQGFLFSAARPVADVAGMLRLDWASEAAA